MKRQMTAMLVGTVMAVTGFTLSVSAATTPQKTISVPSFFSELATSDLAGDINSSSGQLCSTQLQDLQTLCFRGNRTGK